MQPGDIIEGRFEILREVAAGGMGRILQARDRQTGAVIALKLIVGDDAAFAERFIREAVVLADITHPGVVKYIAHGITSSGENYLAMEWLEGEDLQQRLARLRSSIGQRAGGLRGSAPFRPASPSQPTAAGAKSPASAGQSSGSVAPLASGRSIDPRASTDEVKSISKSASQPAQTLIESVIEAEVEDEDDGEMLTASISLDDLRLESQSSTAAVSTDEASGLPVNLIETEPSYDEDGDFQTAHIPIEALRSGDFAPVAASSSVSEEPVDALEPAIEPEEEEDHTVHIPLEIAQSGNHQLLRAASSTDETTGIPVNPGASTAELAPVASLSPAEGVPQLSPEMPTHQLPVPVPTPAAQSGSMRSLASRRSAASVATTVAPGLSVGDTVLLGRRVASALAELHRRGVVHRDIKPSNLYLEQGRIDRVKLLDFGTARLTSGAHDITGTGVLVGTPNYMAPEQIQASRTVGAQADIWALGCVLYESLTLVPPFYGATLGALMADILTSTPPPIQRRRPDTPEALEALIMRMLAKDPAHRPADGDMLANELDALPIQNIKSEVEQPIPSQQSYTPKFSVTTTELRVFCLLAMQPTTDQHVPIDELEREVTIRGGALDVTPNGTVNVTMPGNFTPIDLATRMARTALVLRESAPSYAMALLTGRAESDRRTPANELVDRARELLSIAKAGEIHTDTLTGSLVDARFDVLHQGEIHIIQSERETEGMRTLLGKHTKWVGRQRELDTMLGLYAECIEEPVARAVLVTAPAGMGKTRLRYEFFRVLERRGDPYELLHGQGDSISAGSAFVMIAPAIRRSAGILEGEPIELRRTKLRRRLGRSLSKSDLNRVSAFLGEMIGAPFDAGFDDALDAARKDPILMGDGMRAAWESWLKAECKRNPVILLLEDLHWGDLPTVKFVDSALRTLADQPFLVLTLARPEVHTAFPRLWAERSLQEIRLDALSRKAIAQFVRDTLGPSVEESVVDMIADRSQGNALYLEELIRAVASGSTKDIPDTIFGMLQARIDALGRDAKRALRAASIFGEVFWRGGVTALVGEEGGAFNVSDWLEHLVNREIIVRHRQARIPGEVEYKYRHALVRDAVYTMITEADRVVGHRLAADWLERSGETDSLVLAEHYMRGQEQLRAAVFYQRAASEALEGNDLSGAIQRADQAIVAGAGVTERGQLRALQATAAYWQSQYSEARRYAEEALAVLEPGCSDWFNAVGTAIVASARLGDFNGVDTYFHAALTTDSQVGALPARIICLSRGCFQLIFNGRFARADEVLTQLAILSQGLGPKDSLALAQSHHVRGVRAAMIGDVATFLRHLEAAVEAFDQAGDQRNVLLERTTVAWCYAEIGWFENAENICRKNLEACEAAQAPQAITYAKVNLGYILAYRPGKLDEARQVLKAAIAECRAVNNVRLEGWSRAHLSGVELQSFDFAAAEQEGRTAAELLAAAPGLKSWALACRARALLQLDRAAEALECARAAMEILERLGGLLQGETLPPLVLALSLLASGDRNGAIAAAADAKRRLNFRASRLGNPSWRSTFMMLPESIDTMLLPDA